MKLNVVILIVLRHTFKDIIDDMCGGDVRQQEGFCVNGITDDRNSCTLKLFNVWSLDVPVVDDAALRFHPPIRLWGAEAFKLALPLLRLRLTQANVGTKKKRK